MRRSEVLFFHSLAVATMPPHASADRVFFDRFAEGISLGYVLYHRDPIEEDSAARFVFHIFFGLGEKGSFSKKKPSVTPKTTREPLLEESFALFFECAFHELLPSGV